METIGHHGQKPMLGVLLGERGPAGGIELHGVTPGGGAEAAGLRAGDELTMINDVDLIEADSAIDALKEAMQDVQSGDSVSIGYQRDGSFVMADVTTHARGFYIMGMTGAPTIDMNMDIHVEALEAMAEGLAEKFAEVDFSTEWIESLGALENLESLESLQALGEIAPHINMTVSRAISVGGGLRLENVDADLAGYFGVEQGVLVLGVPAGKEQETDGLKPGDIILTIDGEAIVGSDSAYRALLGKEASVEVMRHGITETVAVANSFAGHRAIMIKRGSTEDMEVHAFSPDSP
jgi:predicted metalloprotease with PDZ domain